MPPAPQRLVPGTELWFQWADVHGVQNDCAGKSLDEIACNYHGTRFVHHELLAPDQAETTSAHHQAAADTAYPRALLIEDEIGRHGGDPDFSVNPAQILDSHGRIVSRRSSPEPAGEWESSATPVADLEEVPQPTESPATKGFRL